ncbi:MAG: DUF4091 domain-containing protein [Phycisphaerae bacterium]|nr:DUF4091 domain-containing protein [Phycisphaerae bacterium]
MRTWRQLLVPLTVLAIGSGPLETIAAAERIPWGESLVADGGGWWSARWVLEVAGEGGGSLRGEVFKAAVGRGAGEIDLIGRRAEGIRVCDGMGRELLFDVSDAEGLGKRTGALAAGDKLAWCIGPVDSADGEPMPMTWPARYLVYFDNPRAGRPAESLGAGLTNGGFEAGGDEPESWRRASADETHHLSWVKEQPRSGQYCGKTVVDGGAPGTWVQWCQQSIPVSAGARYRLTGWVRAKDVKGQAGWYVHVHGATPMVINKVAHAGEGTYDWKQLTIEFETPADAKTAGVGTVLHGTGTAWFDDASLERLDKAVDLRIASARLERQDLREIKGRSDWLLPTAQWPHRVGVVVTNSSDQGMENVVVTCALNKVIHQMCRPGRSARVAVLDPARDGAPSLADVLPSFRYEGNWLFVATLPPRSRKTFHVYLSPTEKAEPSDEKAMFTAMLRSGANLVANADFEAGGDLPEAWTTNSGGGAEGKPQPRFSRVRGGVFGEHCGQVVIPLDAKLQWSGWRSPKIRVRPNATYLYAGWLKTRDVNDGTASLHGHFHAADGSLAKGAPFFGTTGQVSGTSEWTMSRGVIRTPSDCDHVLLHLTMNAHGTVWHDGILFCPAAESRVLGLESAKGPEVVAGRRLHIWQVNPIVKVFRETLPDKQAEAFSASAARNEYEPIQLAIRAGKALRNVKVEVSAPTRGGTSLPAVQVDRVGYVPVDVPSSYYVSRLPSWYRLIPRGTARCDGWSGDWPDPLPPCGVFDMAAGQTQPIWLTVHVPASAPAGAYAGRVTIRADGGVREELPLRVKVRPFVLPERASLRVIYDLRRGPGENPFLDGSIEELRKWYELLAKRRLSPGLLPSPTFAYKDGKVAMDTERFDAAARICIDELKMNVYYSPHLFYAFGWAYKPRVVFGHEAFSDEYVRAYTSCYRAFLDHVKAKGWYDELINYISDEPHYTHEHVVEQMKRICDMAHSVDPKVPLYSSTWRHVPQWDGYLDMWGVGQYGCFPVEEMSRRLAAGDRMLITCDGQQALDTPYLATERLLPYYCFKYGMEGYEFWGVSWWTYDPWERGYHWFIAQSDDGKRHYRVRYPNGDGYLTYPGHQVGLDRPVSSIRLEQAREGIEDYEYICLLRGLVEKARGKDGSGEAIKLAEVALDRARSLVRIPNAGGCYSTEILPDPGVVPAAREALAEAIVGLKRVVGE